MYDDYELAARDPVSSIIDDVPTVSSASKRKYVEHFLAVLGLMRAQAKKVDGLPGQYARMPYHISDVRTSSNDDISFPIPDVMVAFNERGVSTFRNVHMFLEATEESGPYVYLKYLGQIADYALSLRQHQPTRKFVPIFFLHGCELELLVFTHTGYFRAHIGPALFKGCLNKDDSLDMEVASDSIRNSLTDLWFLLTLPADKFGFLIDSRTVLSSLEIDASTVPATMKEVKFDSSNTVVQVEKQTGCPMRIVGRCTYILDVKYKGRAAILKLSWSRTNRLPEGAVYSVLAKHGVSNIPEIFASGVLVEDFDDYRLEFLLMERCGTPIASHFQSKPRCYGPDLSAATEMSRYVEQITATLTDALVAGVLHRDVSAGNIAVEGDRAYVIDWGCARFGCPPADADLRTEIARRWMFDWDDVLATEKGKDEHTGTPLYMSARLLLGMNTRDIYDDLESLFYVVLDALSGRSPNAGPQEQPVGFTFYDKYSMALSRLMCTQSRERYLCYFGASVSSESVLGVMLDQMRQFLFFDDDAHIGTRVLALSDFTRTFDEVAARGFMSEETVTKILRLAGVQTVPEPSAAASVDQSKHKMTHLASTPPSGLDTPASLSPASSTGNSSLECKPRSSSSARSSQLPTGAVASKARPEQPATRKTASSISLIPRIATSVKLPRVVIPPAASSRNAPTHTKAARGAVGSNTAKENIGFKELLQAGRNNSSTDAIKRARGSEADAAAKQQPKRLRH
ncbi:hypothetical protein GGF42_005284 [Coemansia sp. RSA 2424]|nr:hypothetical protein GGF42_005284 [Coemansia sp. RSA 2424]